MSNILKFEGYNYLRQRLILATLSGKPVRIEKIRSDDENPGLREFEIKFLNLLEKVTNGSVIEISYTGTSVLYRPGAIEGGRIQHDCGTDRSISYYLEPMIALAPFSKKPFVLILEGITTDHVDPSVDIIRTVLLPQLKRYGVDQNLELKITKRGAPPLGGGEVVFSCVPIRQLKPVQFTEEGRIKRVRGIAYCTRVSPQTANRLMYTKEQKVESRSPGFALSLVAESNTDVLLSAEKAAEPGQTPEDVGLMAAKLLLSEIRKGGCVDTTSQWLNILLMILAPEDVISFKIQPDTSNDTILMTCMGIGYVNHNKKTT
ncbi:RNA 3'-terminal phosphate cyclase [Rhizopus delemar RA 99-880]|uniref:RNA 3'-terminal phosphate cyclase n=1 Tax=Rhizopus delemar (strain RA 99-880 / ATCC MYA-4621 / FGSC 9543 / NRRL 43880) TaxID=246409 RepID=I1CGT2_RHIO9|nr:RNA 3'-terminal phosphate cyclase [Rhizopus delemar RA 99-880]|eukprot:EIE87662.1 RNA 3'-terminal phosphate cyclase [Rhizopus delemar RA 99-880]